MSRISPGSLRFALHAQGLGHRQFHFFWRQEWVSILQLGGIHRAIRIPTIKASGRLGLVWIHHHLTHYWAINRKYVVYRISYFFTILHHEIKYSMRFGYVMEFRKR